MKLRRESGRRKTGSHLSSLKAPSVKGATSWPNHRHSSPVPFHLEGWDSGESDIQAAGKDRDTEGRGRRAIDPTAEKLSTQSMREAGALAEEPPVSSEVDAASSARSWRVVKYSGCSR